MPRRTARVPGTAPKTASPAPARAPAPAPASTPAPTREKKIDKVIALLRREEGATLAEMVAATSWLPHTTRAALTGLKKKGHAIEKTKRDDVTCYRIVAAG